MILYHITRDLEHDGSFVPTIPSAIMKNEDEVTLRSCWSTSIEGCLSSFPTGSSVLEDIIDVYGNRFKVFRINTDGLNEADIITSAELYEYGIVPDAEITDEHWITKYIQVDPDNTFIIDILGWDEDVEDIIPYHIYKIADEKYEGDYTEAYMEITGDKVPSMITINNLNYKHVYSNQHFVRSDEREEVKV